MENPQPPSIVTEEQAALPPESLDDILKESHLKVYLEALNTFKAEDMLTMNYSMHVLVDAIKKLKNYPSVYTVKEFRKETADIALAKALNDPHVTMALYFKQLYDTNKLPLLEQVDALLAQPDRTPLRREAVMEKFTTDAEYYYPDLPDIEDPDLYDRVWNGAPSPGLASIGRQRFTNEMNKLLYIRFPEMQIIKEISMYVMCNYVSSTWSAYYELPNHGPDAFYTYFGALVMCCSHKDNRREIRKIVSALIEPIVRHFHEPEVVNDTVKDELANIIPSVTYELVFTTHHQADKDKVYIVHAYAANKDYLIGIGIGPTQSQAESKAAAAAMYKKSHLDRAAQCVSDIEEERRARAQHNATIDYENYSEHLGMGSAPGIAGAGVMNQGMAPGVTAGMAPGVQPSPMMGAPGYRQSHIAPHPAHGTVAGIPQSLAEFQTQPEDTNSIPLAPEVPDDEVDKSSKQRLNDLLLELRCSTADYKTTKISNSEVQVVCYINNVPIARAISSNKKKAGHICAQFIRNTPRLMEKISPSARW